MANKNIIMIKSFIKVIKNDKDEINLILPKLYAKNIFEIDYAFLKQKKIKNLIFDIDNTILPVGDINVNERLVETFRTLKKEFNVCIMSNNNESRVLPVAETLKIKYLFEAGKPNKESFEKALEILNAKKGNTAMIGDQMLSDIKGANGFGIYSIMVDPVSYKHDVKTLVSRILQKIMMKKLSIKKIFVEKKYYKKE